MAPLQTPLIVTLATETGPHPEVLNLLRGAIIDNPPVVIRDGGVIADGYDAELDELRQISSNAGDYLLEIEQRERALREAVAELESRRSEFQTLEASLAERAEALGRRLRAIRSRAVDDPASPKAPSPSE